MKTLLFAVLSLVIYSFSFAAVQSNTIPTAVIGFLDTNTQSDNIFNTVILKSFIKALKRLPNSQIVSFQDIEQRAKNYWSYHTINRAEAFRIAQYFRAKQMILGDYSLGQEKDSIQIHVLVYDVVTSELTLERTFSSKGKAGIFNAIDDMAEQISGLLTGVDIQYGTFSILFKKPHEDYTLILDDKKVQIESTDSSYEERIVAGTHHEASLRLQISGKEIARKEILAQPQETVIWDYVPSETVWIENFNQTGTLLINNQETVTIKNGMKFQTNLPAYTSQHIGLHIDNKQVIQTNITLREGEQAFLMLQGQNKPLDPLFNLLIPGIVDLQKGDLLPGSVFIMSWFSGIALTGFGIYTYSVADERYNKFQSQDLKTKYFNYRNEALIVLLTGVSLWALSMPVSLLYDYWTTAQANRDLALEPHLDWGGLALNLNMRF